MEENVELKKSIVNEQDRNQRLDTYVSSLEENVTRSMAQKMIANGNVLVNGKAQKDSYKVKSKDEVVVKIEKPKESHIKAEDIELDIVYEDDDILVINKAKGMVVHPGNGNPDGTLVNAVLNHCKDSLSGIGGEIRPGIVHRLDKDTSGLIIVAKNDMAHLNLANQIKEHEVTKIYTALVKGNIAENEAKIDMPIARSKQDRKKMAVRRDGKEAVTHIKVMKRYGDYTLLKVKIDTGRTHQIRVHMAQIGHPVVGDEVYSSGRNEFNVHGQCLHSTVLEFTHPRTNKKLHLEAKLPEYFEEIINRLDNKKYN